MLVEVEELEERCRQQLGDRDTHHQHQQQHQDDSLLTSRSSPTGSPSGSTTNSLLLDFGMDEEHINTLDTKKSRFLSSSGNNNNSRSLHDIESELAELEQILQDSKATNDMQVIEEKLNEVERGLQVAHSRNQNSENKVAGLARQAGSIKGNLRGSLQE